MAEQDRQLVESLVRGTANVAGIVNELAVMPESSTLQRSNDGLITSKVRTRLINQNGVPSGSIRVMTERGLRPGCVCAQRGERLVRARAVAARQLGVASAGAGRRVV